MQADNRKEHYTLNKEYYNSSVLKMNALSDLCHDISNTEALDINVEKVI